MKEQLRGLRTPSTASTFTAERTIGIPPSASTFKRTLDFTRRSTISSRIPRLGETGLIHIDRIPPKHPPVTTRNVPIIRSAIGRIPRPDNTFSQDTYVSPKEWRRFHKYSKPVWERIASTSSTDYPYKTRRKQLRIQRPPDRETLVQRPYLTKSSGIETRFQQKQNFKRIRRNELGFQVYSSLDTRRLKSRSAGTENKPAVSVFNPELAKQKNIPIFDRRTFMTSGRVNQTPETTKQIKDVEVKVRLNKELKPTAYVQPISEVKIKAQQANEKQAKLVYNKLRAAMIPEPAAKAMVSKAVHSDLWINTVQKTPIKQAAPQIKTDSTMPTTSDKIPELERQKEQKLKIVETFLKRQAQRKKPQNSLFVRYEQAILARKRFLEKTIRNLFKRKNGNVTGADIAKSMPTVIVPEKFKSSFLKPGEHDGTYSETVKNIAQSGSFIYEDEAIKNTHTLVDRDPAVKTSSFGEPVERRVVAEAQSRIPPPAYIQTAQLVLSTLY